MTDEERAIEIIKSECYVFNPLNFDRSTMINTALDMAVKALKQQPCEDAISRQAVEKITWEEASYTDALNVLTEVREKVRALPSVTPQPKIGHWIDEPYYKISEYGEEDTYYTRKCSECFEKYDVASNYCPNCGAKMQEVEENG